MARNITIIGATGVVGREMIKCLEVLKFPVDTLRLVASQRSAGKEIITSFGRVKLEVASEDIFKYSDIALFSAGSEISREFAEVAKKHDCLMIDNSSAFRYEHDVPLVIPSINAKDARKHCGIIANPNCTTAIAAVVLWPLHREFGLKKIIVNTYQAASGAGKNGMDELIGQTKEFLNGKKLTVKYFQHQLAFNVIPHIDIFQKNGYTREEMKVAWEMKKIFNDNSLVISCSAVRIPTLRAHSESIVIETEKQINVERAREVLQHASGVEVIDDPSHNLYPMPVRASGKFDVEVGRIRQNLVFEDHGLEFFISGDQLLRGAALNAVEIAMLFI